MLSYIRRKEISFLPLTSISPIPSHIPAEIPADNIHNKNHYLDIGSGDNKRPADVLEQVLSTMREGVMQGIETKVGMELEAIQFTSGQQFLDWVALTKAELEEFAGCIKQ